MTELPPRSKLPKEFLEALDSCYWEGFELGRDTARRELRDEIAQELEEEMAGSDPDCALCIARKEVAEIAQELRIVKQDRDRRMTRARGWAIREGSYKYRETGKSIT